MKNYKLRLTAISPLHIGTGEDYEPTNFVIDKGYLYEFDELAFYEKLDPRAKDSFLKAVESRASDSLFEVHRVIKANKQHAISSALSKTKVTSGIEMDYKNKVGRAVQMEGGRNVQKSKVFNRFQIARTLKQPNTHIPYIPGSSLKGALSTAYQEGCYKNEKYSGWQRCFGKPLDNIFKNLVVADTIPVKSDAKIGYVLNKERFEEDPLGPSNKMEVINAGSIFETTLKIRDYETIEQVDFDFLKKWCDEHYYKLFQDSFKPLTTFKGQKVDDFTNEYYPEDYFEKYRDFKPKANQFIIRVGKHSGARAVTIDGMREIRVKVSGGGPRRKPNKWETLDQETTTWMFGERERDEKDLLPLGWVLCEVM
jgi:CRISPR-associated protein Csm5